MNNVGRATIVINETYAGEWVKLQMTPPKVAQALADAGLLMPDLPEPDMAQTIAGMEWQWSVERLTEDGSRWLIDRPWTCDRELAETWLREYDDSRLLRRRVGPVEVIDGE